MFTPRSKVSTQTRRSVSIDALSWFTITHSKFALACRSPEISRECQVAFGEASFALRQLDELLKQADVAGVPLFDVPARHPVATEVAVARRDRAVEVLLVLDEAGYRLGLAAGFAAGAVLNPPLSHVAPEPGLLTLSIWSASFDSYTREDTPYQLTSSGSTCSAAAGWLLPLTPPPHPSPPAPRSYP